ncbi:MAG: hypothetical protein WD512_17485 [Candidatus Paceibacterota bacterium]
MSSFTINDINRDEVQRKYVDALVGNMDFLSVQQTLKGYVDDEKRFYSNDDLKDEVLSRSPHVRDEVVYSVCDSFAWREEDS